MLIAHICFVRKLVSVNVPSQNSDATDPESPSVYLAPEMFAKLPVFVAPASATGTRSARPQSTSRQPQPELPGETDTNRLYQLPDKASAGVPQIASTDFLRLTDEPSDPTTSVETDTNRLYQLPDKASADVPQIASTDFLRLTDEPSDPTTNVETGIQFRYLFVRVFLILPRNLGDQEMENFAIVCKDFNSIAAEITVLDADPHEQDSVTVASAEALYHSGDSIVLNAPGDDVVVIGDGPSSSTSHRSISASRTREHSGPRSTMRA